MKNMKLFPKTFFRCLALIVVVLLMTFLLLYSFLPSFYRQYKQREIEKAVKHLASELQNVDVTDIAAAVSAYAAGKEYGYTAVCENGEIICSVKLGAGVMFSEGDVGGEVSGDVSMDVVIEFAEASAVFQAADNQTVIVTLNASLQPIDDAVSVLLVVFPPLLVLCILISAAASFLYARSIVKPIQSLTDTTVQMAKLAPQAACEIRSDDEIGILSQNINDMYDKLLSVISDLEQQVDIVKKVEQEKLDFLLLASHELKTPVTAVRGMVDGMLYNVGVYKDRDTYLQECQTALTDLTKLLQSILENSKMDVSLAARKKSNTDIGALLRQVCGTYNTIAQARGITINICMNQDLYVMVSGELLEKAFSNVISNAVKYTDAGKNINIIMQSNTVVIENECIPLNEEELSHLGEPFYRSKRQDGWHQGSTGLGLYFTDQILSVCELRYSFEPYEKGMRFQVDF
ncbi:MAG: HAMP domain-containing histidine kinase [Clostridium sp.]|nr:HAMP domain-containing histidine kinase [Clostridium sp.]MCM1398545.1 HAMP domain-containing histidine kinase [Clostridium sp.]MCM1459833.1 HAMP domain-containing histidine kinase [Bacteroides sp.]